MSTVQNIVHNRLVTVLMASAASAEAVRAKGINLLPSHMMALTDEECGACVAWANDEITDKALQTHYPAAWKMIQEEGHKNHYRPPPPLGKPRVFEPEPNPSPEPGSINYTSDPTGNNTYGNSANEWWRDDSWWVTH